MGKYKDLPKDEIVDLYSNQLKSIECIAKIYSIWPKTLSTRLKIWGIPKNKHTPHLRKYFVNESYFETIDTPDKAYFLGLIYADGNICDVKNCIRISLNYKDAKILELFRDRLQSNIPISITTRRQSKNYKFIRNPECLLRINSWKMVEDLKRIGATPRKSLTLKFPNINQELVYHFMRGYIDGDGCIKLYKRKYREFHLSFIGTFDFITEAMVRLNKTDINFGVYPVKNEKRQLIKNLYYAKTGRADKILEFLDKLYENDENIHLERKYDIYQAIKEELKNIPLDKRYSCNIHQKTSII